MNKKLQLKDAFFDLLSNNPSRDGFISFMKESLGELDNVDFKEKWIDKDKLSKHILAIANSGGGIIVFGVKQTKEQKFEPVGLDIIQDGETVEKSISKYIPRSLSYNVLDFIYDSDIYGDFSGKNFQVLLIYDTPEYLPFFSLSESKDLKKDYIYVRRGTSSVMASASDLDKIIKRRIDSIFKNTNDLSLHEHLTQLQVLYEWIPRKKKVLVNIGDQYSASLKALQAVTQSLSAWGMCNEYDEVDNPKYPSEDYEDFIVRMIEKKKRKIEKVLDLI